MVFNRGKVKRKTTNVSEMNGKKKSDLLETQGSWESPILLLPEASLSSAAETGRSPEILFHPIMPGARVHKLVRLFHVCHSWFKRK